MSNLGGINIGPAEIAKREAKDGKIQTIIEIMSEINPIVEDMTMVECNQGSSHKSTVRTGLPDPTWRKLYGGVQSTKSTTQQIVDACGMLEMLPEVDIDVIDKASDPAGVRMSEHVAHLEGMAQTVATTMFYGDTSTDPEKFTGIAPRFNEFTRATPDMTKIDYNVFTAGGAGSDNTSIYYVTWGANTTTGLYPKGSVAGLSHKDMGKQLVDATDSSGKFEAYVDKYKWDLGMTVKDWRASGRIANIDVSNLEGESSAADLVKLMIQLQERLRGTKLGKGVWYMHPRVATMLRIQMLGADSSNTDFNVQLTQDNISGMPVMSFGGAPIHKCDAILLTEAAITQAS